MHARYGLKQRRVDAGPSVCGPGTRCVRADQGLIEPIRDFYQNVTFGAGMPFVSYEHDVLARHSNQFGASLLYQRDFMQALDAKDVEAIQELREHRNLLAHDLANTLQTLRIEDYAHLLESATTALFKLNNHHTYMEIGSDPAFRGLRIDWTTAVGSEYVLLKEVVNKVRLMEQVARTG